MLKMIEKITLRRIIYLLGLFLILIKVLFIDFDPPKWDVAQYQPLDELYYALTAVNYFNFGDFFVGKDSTVVGLPILQNIVIYLSLKIFGANYLGLRLGSLIFAMLIYNLYFYILKIIFKKNNLFILLFICLFCFNFWFSLASLIVEPTISRIFSGLISLLLTYKLTKDEYSIKSLILYSFVVLFINIITYPTNFFIIPFYIFTLNYFWIIKYKKISIKNNLFISLGFILAILIYTSSVYIFMDSFVDSFKVQRAHSGRIGFGPKTIIRNILNLKEANMFRFNLTFMFLFIISYFSSIINYIESKISKLEIINFIFISFFFFQSMFLNDFPQRKLIILFPFVLIQISFFVNRYVINKEKISSIAKNLILITIVLCLFFYKNLFGYAFFIVSIIFIIIQRNMKKLVFVLVLILSIPELYYSYKYFYENYSEHYKNMYIDLNKEIKDNIMIGGFSIGGMLYGNKAMVNPYFYYDRNKELIKTIDSLSIDDSNVNYSISYYPDKANIVDTTIYSPYKVILSKEKTVGKDAIYLYREKMKDDEK